MAEYLEREELLRQLRLWHMHRNDAMPDHFHYTGIKAWLEAMPAEDVQPVLRCKDCKEWHRNYLAIDGGKHGCELFQDFTRPDDFCSFGTRMDGET